VTLLLLIPLDLQQRIGVHYYPNELFLRILDDSIDEDERELRGDHRELQ